MTVTRPDQGGVGRFWEILEVLIGLVYGMKCMPQVHVAEKTTVESVYVPLLSSKAVSIAAEAQNVQGWANRPY